MRNADFEPTLAAAERLARRWIDGIDSRPTSISSSAADVVAAADRPFPEMGLGGAEVLEELAAIAEPGLASTGSGRYLALVTGGVTPAALGADWMVSAWDQNAVFADLYPGVVGVELAAARWILEALDLPGDAAVGFTTGGQGANTAGLLAGRHAVLAAHGHDVETAGLIGAPRVNVLLSDEQHSTIPRALRLLGLGTDCATEIPTDSEGRILLADLSVALDDSEGPTIVCVQAGNVNGGAFDPIAEISAEIQRRKSHRDDIWLHVDGAFGLWVRASNRFGHLAAGVEAADSWAVDAHKWLNTPYDCGIVIVRDRGNLARAIGYRAAYLPEPGAVPDPVDSVVESSRRARGVPVWATLRSLGRTGLSDLVDRCCDRASDLAAALQKVEGAEVMHAEINQIVVRFDDPTGNDDHEGHTDRVLAAVQAGGECFPTGTTWQGRSAIRLSVSNWRTDSDDIAVAAAALTAAHRLRG